MKTIRRDELATLILLLAVILGAFIRFSPTILAGFAINDGGMFAAMVDDLRTNHYALPVFTSYNTTNIPYAYPPLGFYLGRITADLLRLPTPEIFRWLPASFSLLSIIAFFQLALKLMSTRLHAALATFIFALMPSVVSWFVMGGGITRSLGQLFMLMTLTSLVILYKENRKGTILWAGLWGTLTVLSHPEAAVHTIASALFFWVMLGRSRISLWNSIQVASLVIFLSAPWWATVILRHGLSPFLSSAHTVQASLAGFNLVFFSFTGELYATVIAVIGLIGLGVCLARRDYFLPIWLVLPFMVEGRSAIATAIIPLSIMAGLAMVDVILPGLRLASKTTTSPDELSKAESGAILYFVMYLLFSTYMYGFQFANVTVAPEDREAMQWVSQNTDNNSRFLTLTGARAVACDPVSEWFPALARRKSILTVQGNEWTLGKDFGNFVKTSADVQSCVVDGDNCLSKLSGTQIYDYIYLSKNLRTDNCLPLQNAKTFLHFMETMRKNHNFSIVYETEAVTIYHLK